MQIQKQYPCIQINAPELRENSKFCQWLNQAAIGTPNGPCAATWQRPGKNQPQDQINADCSDLFIWKEGLEGSDTDMPEEVWNQICELVGKDFTGIIWINFH